MPPGRTAAQLPGRRPKRARSRRRSLWRKWTVILTGQTVRDLVGYNFTVSSNGKEVADVGWVRHFAPPYAKSEYLQIDYTTIYPLPKGMSPLEQKGLPEPPKVVQRKGLLYQGIHPFMPEMHWSPDSQRVALVDCVYDWKATAPNRSLKETGRSLTADVHS